MPGFSLGHADDQARGRELVPCTGWYPASSGSRGLFLGLPRAEPTVWAPGEQTLPLSKALGGGHGGGRARREESKQKGGGLKGSPRPQEACRQHPSSQRGGKVNAWGGRRGSDAVRTGLRPPVREGVAGGGSPPSAPLPPAALSQRHPLGASSFARSSFPAGAQVPTCPVPSAPRRREARPGGPRPCRAHSPRTLAPSSRASWAKIQGGLVAYSEVAPGLACFLPKILLKVPCTVWFFLMLPRAPRAPGRGRTPAAPRRPRRPRAASPRALPGHGPQASAPARPDGRQVVRASPRAGKCELPGQVRGCGCERPAPPRGRPTPPAAFLPASFHNRPLWARPEGWGPAAHAPPGGGPPPAPAPPPSTPPAREGRERAGPSLARGSRPGQQGSLESSPSVDSANAPKETGCAGKPRTRTPIRWQRWECVL